jgi:hypothetical protein
MVAFASAPVTGKNLQPETSLTLDVNTYLWINDILCMVYNNGNFGYDEATILGKTDGFYFPFASAEDNKTVLYAAGIWLGAKVGDDIRVAISEYSTEFRPGPMNDGLPQTDEPGFRVYKIGGGLNYSGTPYDDSWDRAEWPVDDGAPVDDYGDPLQLGDQMCWSVYNDADISQHTNMATEPLGVEVQQSTFGFSMYGTCRNIIFLKYTIINKGSDVLDSMYVSLWADPDIGNSMDDLVGCDTLLSLGYSYNDGADAQYGTAAPAVGFCFFQSPIVPSPGDTAFLPNDTIPDYKELGMSSFNKCINGTDPMNYLETYNYMRGLNRDGSPVVDPKTAEPTLYSVPGDPVTVTGWTDDNPDDRRFLMSSGPFMMEPGDTQIVMAVVLAARSSSALASVALLKENSLAVQGFCDSICTMAADQYETDRIVPNGFSLYQNYPNPFNPSTTIEFYLDRTSEVETHILNALGREVRHIDLGRLGHGAHSTVWDGRDDSGYRVSSGLYLYRVKAGSRTLSKKMILLK